MNYAIEIKDLTVYYNNTCALSGINLTVAKNDFLAIIGPNGGGKSTLVKSVLGIVKPQNGEIKIFGQRPEKYTVPIGYVPQFSHSIHDFPIMVIDVILTGRLQRGTGLFHRYSKKDYEIAENMLDKLNITHLKDRQISELSGGQFQKVMILRALATEPELLLLDEFLKEINRSVTIILITHDTAAISSYVKNVACLNKKLFYHGEIELDNDIIQKTFGCPVDLIAHGVPHRVLKNHGE
jgi:zinc transport system ATP-binding protein